MEEPGRGKAKSIGILTPYVLVFITSKFLTWLGITIYVKKLYASNSIQ